MSSNALTLRQLADGRLVAVVDGADVPVSVRRCFPWSEPARFLSLRDAEDKELALVRELSDLDGDSRAALEAALAQAGFVLRVTRIHAVEEEFEIRVWKVDTQQGSRQFQTARDEWPRPLPDGGFLLRDVAADIYHFPDPETLDELSRNLLWAFVD